MRKIYCVSTEQYLRESFSVLRYTYLACLAGVLLISSTKIKSDPLTVYLTPENVPFSHWLICPCRRICTAVWGMTVYVFPERSFSSFLTKGANTNDFSVYTLPLLNILRTWWSQRGRRWQCGGALPAGLVRLHARKHTSSSVHPHPHARTHLY
jgi:hypothetical protein